jgi:DNA or RNA helicases of superfamily II
VRSSAVATPTLVRQFEAAFETYWNDDAFRSYDPATDADLLDRALSAESGGGAGPGLVLSGLEVRARPHQERILEALAAERELHDRHRNLVVAATGTGKTIVAALDYRRLRAAGLRSLLFVAHRSEILEQSLRTYREVLADGSFGELLVGEHRPADRRHVFASVQSMARIDLATLPPYDVVVIDEFHHAQAPTYRRLLAGVRQASSWG